MWFFLLCLICTYVFIVKEESFFLFVLVLLDIFFFLKFMSSVTKSEYLRWLWSFVCNKFVFMSNSVLLMFFNVIGFETFGI